MSLKIRKFRLGKSAIDGDTHIADDSITADNKIKDATLTGSTIIKDGTIPQAKLDSTGITKSKLGYKVVSVTVAASATSGSSAADSDLVGGEILGIYPTGNQDQFVDNVVLNADGSVTVTLAAAATADNTFNVVVLKP